MLNQELYRLFDFDEGDLAANRAGKLSLSQTRMMEVKHVVSAEIISNGR